ncbi:unnamed protein product [Urochloa humidicola]
MFDAVPPPSSPPPPPGDMVTRTFTFGPSEVNAIRKGLPLSLRDTATTFEVLTAALWRARTAALELSPDEGVRLAFVCNIRGLPELGLPAGYYGNAVVPVAVLVTAEALLAGSLGDTVERVREAKAMVTVEYVQSTTDLLVLRGRPRVPMSNLFLVSDNRHTGFYSADFGWGVPVFAGLSSTISFFGSFILAVRNSDGENAAALPIMLPRPAMDRFALEVERLVKD